MVILVRFCDLVILYFINEVQLLSLFLLPPFSSSFYRLIVGKSNRIGASFSYYQNRTMRGTLRNTIEPPPSGFKIVCHGAVEQQG